MCLLYEPRRALALHFMGRTVYKFKAQFYWTITIMVLSVEVVCEMFVSLWVFDGHTTALAPPQKY
jgi:hypothetical protein